MIEPVAAAIPGMPPAALQEPQARALASAHLLASALISRCLAHQLSGLH